MDRQIITVDIAPGSNAQQRLMVSQGDIGRPLGVRIIQNGLPLNCTGYTAHLYVLKPDHNYYERTCTISNNNLISWDTAEQETPVAGECLAAIRIMDQDHDIGTATFVEFVEASPADLGYASESFVSSMTEYVDAAQQAAQQAEQIVTDTDNVSDVAVDSSGHIVLTKRFGGTVTSDETVFMPVLEWGTSLTVTANKGHVLLAIGNNYLVSVWLASTNTIYVLVITNTGNIFYKYADNTISFGDTASESHVTITRSGRSITITTDFYSTITPFGYPV